MKKLLSLVFFSISILVANENNNECLNVDYKTCFELNEAELKSKCDEKDHPSCYLLDTLKYEKLCAQNDLESCYKLAGQYEDHKKYKKAFKLHTKACDGGYFSSCDYLGFFMNKLVV